MFVHPNPARNEARVTFSGATAAQVVIRVTDITGAVLQTREAGDAQSGHIVLDISGLAAGVYMVETTHGKQKTVQRLIKE